MLVHFQIAVRVDDEATDTLRRRDYASTLRTFDATDYSSIGNNH